MGTRQETTVREFCEAWGDGEHIPDADKLASMFAEDACWTLYMPNGPRIRGRQAIRAEISRQMTYIEKPKCNILRITSSRDTVITERADTFVKNGKQVTLQMASVFELAEDGLILAWREYFDTLDLARQAQDDPAAISGLEV